MSCKECKYGKDFKTKHFLLEPHAVFMNHGSYGAVPNVVFEKQLSLKRQMEQHPDLWHRKKNVEHYRETLQVLCGLIKSEVKNTVLVENCTFGVYSVLQSIKWQPNDVILITNLTYNAMSVMCEDMAEKFGTRTEKLIIDFPIRSEQQIIQLYKNKLQEIPAVRLAIIDHITSPSCVKMPIKDIVKVCKGHNVISVIDGAHALGQIGLSNDVPDIQADFYAGNVHKWMFTPRGFGYLWIDSKHLSIIRPAIVSHFHGVLPQYDFCVRGTRDDTAYYTLQEALKFFKSNGGWDKMSEYNNSLLVKAVKDLTAAWGTEELEVADEMKAPFQRLIRVPDLANFPKTPTGGGMIEKELYSRFNIQIMCMMTLGELYIRISAHVYNDESDYQKLKNSIRELRNEPKKPSENKSSFEIPMMHWDLSPFST